MCVFRKDLRRPPATVTCWRSRPACKLIFYMVPCVCSCRRAWAIWHDFSYMLQPFFQTWKSGPIWWSLEDLSPVCFLCLVYLPTLLIWFHCRVRRQGHREVFELIHEKKLYSALLDNLVPLMEVDIKVKSCVCSYYSPSLAFHSQSRWIKHTLIIFMEFLNYTPRRTHTMYMYLHTFVDTALVWHSISTHAYVLHALIPGLIVSMYRYMYMYYT